MAESGARPSQGRFLLTRVSYIMTGPTSATAYEMLGKRMNVKADTASKWWCNKRVRSCENKKDPV